MDEFTKQKLTEKNKKLIDMVIERVKRDFPDEIEFIGLTGSFSKNDFHEKSDLDLVILNNTDKGWGIADGFIFDDVGYDIYCASWDNAAKITDMQILYCSKQEHIDKYNKLKEQTLQKFAEPIGINCINRAKECIDRAKQEYANTMLSDDLCKVRYASGEFLGHIVHALADLNNSCIDKYGIKRFLEELLKYKYLPENFEMLYMAVIEAKSIQEIRESSLSLLNEVNQLYDKMRRDFTEQPVPTYDNLWGTYEELWCDCRNKVIRSVNLKDKSYAFYAAIGAQSYFDEMTAEKGTKKFDLLQYFDADNLDIFKDAFLKAMDEYLKEYDKVGRKVLKFDTFEELYDYYMKK